MSLTHEMRPTFTEDLDAIIAPYLPRNRSDLARYRDSAAYALKEVCFANDGWSIMNPRQQSEIVAKQLQGDILGQAAVLVFSLSFYTREWNAQTKAHFFSVALQRLVETSMHEIENLTHKGANPNLKNNLGLAEAIAATEEDVMRYTSEINALREINHAVKSNVRR